MHMYQSLEGPEFLEAVADAEAAHSNDINASEYHRRARQWKSDLQALQQTQLRCQDLEDRLREIGAKARV